MKIIHLSDLHFGTDYPALVEALRASVESHKADLVIVSGDFTQVGSGDEFRRARLFIDSLSAPVFCVPGNHDVSRFNIAERILNPFRKYKSYIVPDLNPVLATPMVHVVGLNSARRILPHWNWANGAISARQRDFVRQEFTDCTTPYRMCVLHHPVHKVSDMPLDTVVFGGAKTMRIFEENRIDLVLTGHVHHASLTTFKGRNEHEILYLSASTALSSRLRKQENGYNVIRLTPEDIRIDIVVHEEGAFILKNSFRHKRRVR